MALTLEQLQTAFEANQAEAAGAFKRAFDTDIQFAEAGPQTWETDQSEPLEQAGIIMICNGTDETGLISIPAESGLLPDWYTAPDPTQNGRLQGLALEFGSLILPEEMEAFDCKAIAVSNISEALKRGGISDDTVAAIYELTAGETKVSMVVTAPCPNTAQLEADESSESASASSDPADENAPGSSTEAPNQPEGEPAEQSLEDVINQLNAAVETDDSPPKPEAAAASPPEPPEAAAQPTSNAAADSAVEQKAQPPEDVDESLATKLRRSLPADSDTALNYLPTYTKSLLRVSVPMSVTLATTKKSVQQILEMSPGTIIQFDKPCEAPLTVEVRGCDIAQGEVVRVGEKFGIRISAILPPPERFNGIKTLKKTSHPDS